MARFALAAIEKRIQRFEQRARLLQVGPLVITYTGDWTPEDRAAYALADEAGRAALEQKYTGPLSEHPDPLGIRGIVVVRAERPPDDDEDDDLPGGWTAEQRAEAIRQRDAVSAEMAIDAELEAQRQRAAAAIDPRDPNPDGDPAEIVYHDDLTGYPVSRAEHQHKREQARQRELARQGGTQSGYTSYSRMESR